MPGSALTDSMEGVSREHFSFPRAAAAARALYPLFTTLALLMLNAPSHSAQCFGAAKSTSPGALTFH